MTTMKTLITGHGNYVTYLEDSIFMLSFSIKAFITNMENVNKFRHIGGAEKARKIVHKRL